MIPLAMNQIEESIVPISRFNKGEANKIFNELQEDGVKAVFKNNRREAVLLSPEIYDHLIEMLEDELLFEEMQKRILRAEENGSKKYSFAEAMEAFGVTEAMLEDAEDDEIE